MNKLFVFLLVGCFIFSFVSSESWAYNYLDEGEEVQPGGNYSIDVNNSQYWDGNPYNASRYGLWKREGTQLKPYTDGDDLNISGSIYGEFLDIEGNANFGDTGGGTHISRLIGDNWIHLRFLETTGLAEFGGIIIYDDANNDFEFGTIQNNVIVPAFYIEKNNQDVFFTEDIDVTGKGNFGSSYTATVGDDSNSRGGYFTAGSNTATLATGSYGGRFEYAGGTYYGEIGSSSGHGVYGYGSNGVYGKYAFGDDFGIMGSSNGGVYGYSNYGYAVSGYTGSGSASGYFYHGSGNYGEVGTGSYGVNAYAYTGVAGRFEYSGAGSVDVASSTYGIYVQGSWASSGAYFDYSGSNIIELATSSYSIYTNYPVYFGSTIYTSLSPNSAVYTDVSGALTTGPAGGSVNGTSINVTDISVGSNFEATDSSNYTYFSKQEDIGICFNETHVVLGEAITGQCG